VTANTHLSRSLDDGRKPSSDVSTPGGKPTLKWHEEQQECLQILGSNPVFFAIWARNSNLVTIVKRESGVGPPLPIAIGSCKHPRLGDGKNLR
jgi:hypothetical protein